MAYADRHLWSAEFDGSSTGDKAYFGGFTNRVQIHRISVALLDATTGAGEVVFDSSNSAGTRGSADVGTITQDTGEAAGHISWDQPATDPFILNIGEAVIVEVTDAFDALAIAGIEYSILDQSLDMVTNDEEK
jgi:hypothetical protein